MVKYICKCKEFKPREVSMALLMNFASDSGSKYYQKQIVCSNCGLRNPSIEIGDVVDCGKYLHKVIYIEDKTITCKNNGDTYLVGSMYNLTLDQVKLHEKG